MLFGKISRQVDGEQRRQRLKGKVIKAVASRFHVHDGKKVTVCVGRKKLKIGGDIYVGDNVVFSLSAGTGVIEEVLPRKNSLIRPYVANIDMCLILIAPVPKPDFLLADKIILNCFMTGIEPVLVVNKSDIGAVDVSSFEGVADVFNCSAETGDGIEEIVRHCTGKTVGLAGQSAVGKSALVNAILQEEVLKTGGLSKKVNRGKHTTRHNELLDVGSFFVIDTSGFSMLEMPDIEPEDLSAYYDDFVELSNDCKYKGKCTHVSEPDCAVKAALAVGKLSKERYDRYVELLGLLGVAKQNRF